MKRECSYNSRARRLGYGARDFQRGFYFLPNPKIDGDVIHEGGKAFKKGTVYDAIVEGIPKKRFKKMMGLKMNGINLFIFTQKSFVYCQTSNTFSFPKAYNFDSILPSNELIV